MKSRLEKLQTFSWEGINKRGLRVKGKLVGFSLAIIQAELKRQGIEPINVKKQPKPLFSFKGRIKTTDIVLFSRHLATMVCAGIPLVQALEMISKGQSKIALQALLQTVKNDVTSGKTFHESLAKHRAYFSELFTNLIKTGEMSGTLDVMLKRLADYMEKSESLRKRIRKATFYPITVLGISLIIASLLLIFIMPQFESLFKSFAAELPFFTRSVISLSQLLKQCWYLVFSGLGLSIWLFIYAKKHSKNFKNKLDAIFLKVPIFGKLLKKAIIARVTRTLATTLSAGIPVTEALSTVATVANNNLYTTAINQIRDDIATGQQIHTAMSNTQVFPNMVVQMIAVGEESGTVDSMLDRVAAFYEEDVDNMVGGLSTMIEPIIMVILAAIIGSFVLAMYLPIFRLGSIV